jgi:hypothetical protein
MAHIEEKKDAIREMEMKENSSDMENGIDHGETKITFKTKLAVFVS